MPSGGAFGFNATNYPGIDNPNPDPFIQGPPQPLDTMPDGIDPVSVMPGGSARNSEFPASTRVLYVNGIASTGDEARSDAKAYADAIHHKVEVVHVATTGFLSDLGTTAREKADSSAAEASIAEHAIAKEVVSLALAGKNVHIMAFSRGAIVVERGLELAQSEMRRRGLNSADQAKVFSHVTLETVNGASHYVPDGVRAVHYVRAFDPVATTVGMSPVAPDFRAAAAGAMLPDFPEVSAVIALGGINNHPNGPIIVVPNISPDVGEQHQFTKMMPSRVPFQDAYGRYEREHAAQIETHPQANGMSSPASPSHHPDAARAHTGTPPPASSSHHTDAAHDHTGTLPPANPSHHTDVAHAHTDTPASAHHMNVVRGNGTTMAPAPQYESAINSDSKGSTATDRTAYAPLKTTDMTSEQLAIYVDIRKEARAVFAEALGTASAPTVSVERNGISSDEERFSNSAGRIVGLEDGKLIQQSARGQMTAFDYGDLLVSAKDPVAFDAIARQALTTGEPMNLSMQQGHVAMVPQPAFEQQHTLQRGAAELSLGR
jgi:hypothetical protein